MKKPSRHRWKFINTLKLEGIEEKEYDIPETPSKYDKIDKTRVSSRKYTNLKDIK